ncbi:hypothetical protein [Caulobacter phage Cr30]|nr:hypothetical protein OZ74_gp119 [Caulobacter phage Cr30]AGS81004.1 hypothetical protein [Caulobacter phage Cr30]
MSKPVKEYEDYRWFKGDWYPREIVEKMIEEYPESEEDTE